MCSVFGMIFVQFFGVIKCLNNPFFTICRIAHTKNPHRAIFKVTDSYLESGYISKIYPYVGYIQNLTFCKVQQDLAQAQVGHVLQIYPRTLHISCVPLTDALGLETQGKNPFRPTNSTYEIIS